MAKPFGCEGWPKFWTALAVECRRLDAGTAEDPTAACGEHANIIKQKRLSDYFQDSLLFLAVHFGLFAGGVVGFYDCFDFLKV